jgi:hypothetical protein
MEVLFPMRRFVLVLAISGCAFAQSMVEFGAAAATGTVGGASGKKVSDGITAIMGKVSATTEKAAAAEKAPAMKVSAGVPKDIAGPDPSGVPAPPPARAPQKIVPIVQAQAEIPAVMGAYSEPLPVLPPPPTMTREKLPFVQQGLRRSELLKLGDPASKLSMFEEGHLVETYSYKDSNGKFGTVRLKDGSVASVAVQ